MTRSLRYGVLAFLLMASSGCYVRAYDDDTVYRRGTHHDRHGDYRHGRDHHAGDAPEWNRERAERERRERWERRREWERRQHDGSRHEWP